LNVIAHHMLEAFHQPTHFDVTEYLVPAFVTVLQRQARYANHLEIDVLQEVDAAERISETTWCRLLQAFRGQGLIVPIHNSLFSVEDLGDLVNHN